MLPRERVFTTLDHKEPDLTPWGEHAIDYNVYEAVLGRPTFVRAKMKETRAWWDGRREEIVASYKRDLVDLADALGMDIIAVGRMPSADSVHEPWEQLDENTYRDPNGSLHHVSATTHDLCLYQSNLPPAQPPTVESLEQQIDHVDREGVPKGDDSCWEVVRHVVKERKSTHLIAVFGSDIGFPCFGNTDEERYLNIALYPELHAKLSEVAGKHAIADLKHCAEEGADAVIACGDLGSSTALLASPKVYHEHVFPWHKAYCEEAHRLGMRVMKHCCGCIWEVVDDFMEAGYDAYEAIQQSAGMDIKLLKERCRGRMTLWGGVTNENLIDSTPEAVREDARYAIKWGAPGGGFIYGASHSIAVGTSLENVMAMKQAREELGVYPIRL